MKPTLRLLLHQEEQKARHIQKCMRDSRLLFERLHYGSKIYTKQYQGQSMKTSYHKLMQNVSDLNVQLFRCLGQPINGVKQSKPSFRCLLYRAVEGHQKDAPIHGSSTRKAIAYMSIYNPNIEIRDSFLSIMPVSAIMSKISL